MYRERNAHVLNLYRRECEDMKIIKRKIEQICYHLVRLKQGL